MSRSRADNAATQAWAAQTRDGMVAAAQPWMQHVGRRTVGPDVLQQHQAVLDGLVERPLPGVPAVGAHVRVGGRRTGTTLEDAVPALPGAVPQERFPASSIVPGLNEQGIFEPARADRSLLFNVEHPDPTDPLHGFGVDDGEGYVAGEKRWRFIGAYLIYGQWKQAIVVGIRQLAAAYLVSG